MNMSDTENILRDNIHKNILSNEYLTQIIEEYSHICECTTQYCTKLEVLENQNRNYEREIEALAKENTKLKAEIQTNKCDMDNVYSFIKQYQVDKQEFQKVMMQMNILRNENKQLSEKLNNLTESNQSESMKLNAQMNQQKELYERTINSFNQQIEQSKLQTENLKTLLKKEQIKSSSYLKELSEFQNKCRIMEKENREKALQNIISATSSTNVTFYKEKMNQMQKEINQLKMMLKEKSQKQSVSSTPTRTRRLSLLPPKE